MGRSGLNCSPGTLKHGDHACLVGTRRQQRWHCSEECAASMVAHGAAKCDAIKIDVRHVTKA